MKANECHCESTSGGRSNPLNLILKIAALAFGFLAMTAFLLAASIAHAGKLDEFEKKLDAPKETKVEQKKSVDQEIKEKGEPGKAVETIGESLFQTFLGMFLAGAFEMAQEDDLKYVYKYLKKNEIPALPTFRFEGGYQYLAGKDQAASGRVEIGYLMIGAEGEYKRFWERSPDDHLNVASGHIMLRTLFSDVFQISLALGEKFVWGDTRHDGFEIGFPFYIIFGKHYLFDVRPYLAFIGGNELYDFSSGISYKYKLLGARAGYRSMGVDNFTLHGPEAGLFMQW